MEYKFGRCITDLLLIAGLGTLVIFKLSMDNKFMGFPSIEHTVILSHITALVMALSMIYVVSVGPEPRVSHVAKAKAVTRPERQRALARYASRRYANRWAPYPVLRCRSYGASLVTGIAGLVARPTTSP